VVLQAHPACAGPVGRHGAQHRGFERRRPDHAQRGLRLLQRLCLAPPPAIPLPLEAAVALFQTVPGFEIVLVDRAVRLTSGEIALTPQWVQTLSGNVHDYRLEIYARAMTLSYPSRRGSLFDMAYAALAEQAQTTMWTIDERFYNNARATGLAFVMHPGRDPLPE
jgi:hypothetical protein